MMTVGSRAVEEEERRRRVLCKFGRGVVMGLMKSRGDKAIDEMMVVEGARERNQTRERVAARQQANDDHLHLAPSSFSRMGTNLRTIVKHRTYLAIISKTLLEERAADGLSFLHPIPFRCAGILDKIRTISPSQWKVLIVDDHTRSLIDEVLQINEILSLNVTGTSTVETETFPD
jgi:hypothetical protein